MANKGRPPLQAAEYEVLKAESKGELTGLREQILKLSTDGHDELCVVSRFYTETCDHVLEIRDPGEAIMELRHVVRLLTFALIEGCELPERTGCEH